MRGECIEIFAFFEFPANKIVIAVRHFTISAIWWPNVQPGSTFCFVVLKGDTDASILDCVKIVQI
jgi:hypothetical protein